MWRSTTGSISVSTITNPKVEVFYWTAILVSNTLGTGISRTALFWSAFVLTRPLGATLGDVLTKPMDHGGLNLGRLESSLVITVFLVAAILLTSQRAEQPTKSA